MPIWDVKLYDLLKAYGRRSGRKDADTYQIEPMQFFSVEEAAERLGRMLGIAIDWQSLEAFLPAGLTDPTTPALGDRLDLRGRPAACQGRPDRAAPDRALRPHPSA